MLEHLFIQILNMSFVGSFVIIAVWLLRMLIKQMPKRFSYYLWIVPLIRLAIPFSFESIVSLIPVNPQPIPQNIAYTRTPVINSGVQVVNSSINSSLPTAEVVASMNPMQLILSIGATLWVIGLVAFLFHAIYSFMKLKKQLFNAETIDGKIYKSDNIDTAFVLGIIKPKIFLPTEVKDEEMDYILCHEQTHIKRFDHVMRSISYLVLAIYWFNPLVWAAFYLSGKDMEMSCDESVIEQLGENVKKDYSRSLLNFSTRNYKLNVSPLAFGEGNTKGRIKNILSYKKPRIFFVVIAVVILLVGGVGLLTNPLVHETFPGNIYKVEEILFSAPMYSFTYSVESAPAFNISEDYHFYTKPTSDSDWTQIGVLKKLELKQGELLSWVHFTEFLDEKAINLINKKSKVYKVRTDKDINDFYLVLETKAQEVLILYGYESDQGVSIRWIFDVSAVESIDIARQLEYPNYIEKKATVETPNQGDASVVIDAQAVKKTQTVANPKISGNKNTLDQAISEVILKRNKDNWAINDDSLPLESHINLLVETSKDDKEVIVYTMVFFEVVEKADYGLQALSGFHIPSRLTFEKDSKDGYQLVDYWEPRDGSYYMKDIKKVFPENISDDAMDTQKYILKQIQSVYAQAVDALKIDTGRVIDYLLEEIMSSPLEASAPEAYIKAHKIEYRELTYYGNSMIEYIERSKAQNDEGLKSQILDILYEELTID